MATQYKIKGTVTLEPVYYENAIPEVLVKLDNSLLFAGKLEQTTGIEFDQILISGIHRLSVEFYNKKDSDTKIDTGQDKAVMIKAVDFFGITSPRFLWEGRYRPVYPSHMQGRPEVLQYHDYLGWNGIWFLDFTIPVFTWIHQIENLGWINY